MSEVEERALLGVVESELPGMPDREPFSSASYFDDAAGAVENALKEAKDRLNELRRLRDEVIAVEVKQLVADVERLERMARIATKAD